MIWLIEATSSVARVHLPSIRDFQRRCTIWLDRSSYRHMDLESKQKKSLSLHIDSCLLFDNATNIKLTDNTTCYFSAVFLSATKLFASQNFLCWWLKNQCQFLIRERSETTMLVRGEGVKIPPFCSIAAFFSYRKSFQSWHRRGEVGF